MIMSHHRATVWLRISEVLIIMQSNILVSSDLIMCLVQGFTVVILHTLLGLAMLFIFSEVRPANSW